MGARWREPSGIRPTAPWSPHGQITVALEKKKNHFLNSFSIFLDDLGKFPGRPIVW